VLEGDWAPLRLKFPLLSAAVHQRVPPESLAHTVAWGLEKPPIPAGQAMDMPQAINMNNRTPANFIVIVLKKRYAFIFSSSFNFKPNRRDRLWGVSLGPLNDQMRWARA
jgi:hypothetical protein